MGRMTMVEVRDPAGTLVQRSLVAGDEFTVGRGPENDVILQDEYSDPRHLAVRAGGSEEAVVVRDLETRNGTRVGEDRLSGEERRLAPGEAVRIGESVVTFLPPDEPTGATPTPPQEVEDEPADMLLPWTRMPGWTLALAATVLLGLAASTTGHEVLDTPTSIGMGIFLGALLVAWCGAWAVGAKLATGRGRMRGHLAFASLVTLVAFPVTTLLSWISFASSSPLVETVVGYGVTGWGFWTLLVFGHLDIASRRSRRTKLAWSGAVGTALLLLGVLFVRFADAPTLVVQRSLTAIQPVPTGLTRSTDLEGFLGGLGSLEGELAEDAAEALEERPLPE